MTEALRLLLSAIRAPRDAKFTLHNGDCLDVLRTMPENSVDSIVTDPPYGLSFMGKKWDYDVPSEAIWRECLRVLKPGGHLLAFAGTRTQHRMAVRIEDAGFEIRDLIAWVYGSGFPKSLDVSKAIDKGEGFWRGRAGAVKSGNDAMSGGNYERTAKGDPVTAAAAAWQGWGTALKPALEPITVARKPLAGTVAENVLQWGCGGLNIDGCRIPGWKPQVTQGINSNASSFNVAKERRISGDSMEGRWPANLIHDGSGDVLAGFPEGNSRFFYCAKASKKDRDEGLDGFRKVRASEITGRVEGSAGLVMEGGKANPYAGTTGEPRANNHPTVKPTDLMRYLARLVTPPGGVVLDPFMGSGSTGKAAMLEGFRFIGIERDEQYMGIARARIGGAL